MYPIYTDTRGTKVPHTFLVVFHSLKIQFFSLWPVIFKLQAILRQVHRIIHPNNNRNLLHCNMKATLHMCCYKVTGIPNFILWRSIFKIQVHRMTPECPNYWTVNRHPENTNLPPPLKVCSVSFNDQPFSRCMVVQNWKCIAWHWNDLEHLTVKSTLYTLSTYPRAPPSPEAQILVRFAWRPAVSEVQGCR